MRISTRMATEMIFQMIECYQFICQFVVFQKLAMLNYFPLWGSLQQGSSYSMLDFFPLLLPNPSLG